MSIGTSAKFVDRANSEEISLLVSTYLDAREDVKKRPYQLTVALQEAYGDDMGEFPRPGTKAGDALAGNNPDAYDEIRSGEKVKGTHSADFALATREGQIILHRLKNWQQVQKDPNAIPAPIKENGVLIESYSGHTPAKVDREVAKWTARKNAIVALYRTAIRLYYAIYDVNSIKGITCMLQTEDDDEGKPTIVDTIKPVYMFDDTNLPHSAIKRWQQFTVGSFLSMDLAAVHKRIADGMNAWEAITGGKKKKTEEEAAKTGKAVWRSKEEFHTGLAAMMNTLDLKEMKLSLHKDLKAKDNEYLIRAIGDIYMTLKTEFMPGIARQYSKMTETKLEDFPDDEEQAA